MQPSDSSGSQAKASSDARDPVSRGGAESAYAWTRLAVSLLLSTIGGVGMWSVVVVLPAVQQEFGVARADASLPYTLTMIGFGLSSIVMGRLSDRFGIMVPVIIGALAQALGFAAAGSAASLWQFALAQGLLIGAGSAATFAPLLAHTSLWFARRRGIAVAIFATGNYLAGAVWPPIVQHFIQNEGWRHTYIGIGVFCVASMLPLALLLRRPAPLIELELSDTRAVSRRPVPTLPLSSRALQTLLIIAGLCCCVAMSMPQVHLVAYCGDLGYGPARGAEMLSLMLACGAVSRVTFGFICDRIGGLRTLLLGSSLQIVALFLFLPFNGLVSLYVISALFGLFQGGIVPAYAIIVREYFPAREAGARIGAVVTATLFGMALGGWMSGVIFDLTGSYRAAFVNGIVFNLVNVSIAWWLLRRTSAQPAMA
jgi:MFS family permease